MVRMYAYEVEKDGTFYIETEIDEEADAILLQRHFRDAIRANRGINISFGFNAMCVEAPMMD